MCRKLARSTCTWLYCDMLPSWYMMQGGADPLWPYFSNVAGQVCVCVLRRDRTCVPHTVCTPTGWTDWCWRVAALSHPVWNDRELPTWAISWRCLFVESVCLVSFCMQLSARRLVVSWSQCWTYPCRARGGIGGYCILSVCSPASALKGVDLEFLWGGGNHNIFMTTTFKSPLLFQRETPLEQ